jgi:hypothetical protein
MSEENRIEYSDHPEFNEWLNNDSENNIVTIAGYTFLPSEALYKMNYGQYVEAYQEYLKDDTVLLNDIYANFPTPIAFYLYQAEENFDNAHHRLDLLKSAWEALVYFLYGIVVSEARHRQVPLQNTGVDLKDYYSDRLASRLGIIENILDFCEKNRLDLSSAKLISVDATSKLRLLNQKRNEFEHSFAATTEQQTNLYHELFPEILSALKLLRNLGDVNVFRFHSIEDGGPLLPRCDAFRGYSLDGRKRFIRLSEEDYHIVLPYFNAQSVFAQIEDGGLFCLSPFIHFKKDPQDGHPRLIVYKKKAPESRYKFGIIGQAGSIELDKVGFKDRDEELRKLVMGVAI